MVRFKLNLELSTKSYKALRTLYNRGGHMILPHSKDTRRDTFVRLQNHGLVEYQVDPSKGFEVRLTPFGQVFAEQAEKYTYPVYISRQQWRYTLLNGLPTIKRSECKYRDIFRYLKSPPVTDSGAINLNTLQQYLNEYKPVNELEGRFKYYLMKWITIQRKQRNESLKQKHPYEY